MYGASNRRWACLMASKTQNQTVPTLFPIHAVGRFPIRSVGDGKSSGRRLDVLGHQWHCLPRDDYTRCPRQWLSRRTDLSPNGASQKAWLSLGRGDRAASSPSLQNLNRKGTDLLFLKNKYVPFSVRSLFLSPLLCPFSLESGSYMPIYVCHHRHREMLSAYRAQ